MTNTSWLQRVPALPQAPKIAAPKQQATFTSLRAGQWPKHPRAQKAPKLERPPNFSDEGDVGDAVWWNNPSVRKASPEQRAPDYSDDGIATSALPQLGPQNIPDYMTLPEEPDFNITDRGGQPMSGYTDNLDPDTGAGPLVPPPDTATIHDPTDIDSRNDALAKSPYAPIPPFMPKDAQGNPVTPDTLSAQLAQFPQNNPPKWWQRALAAGVGGMAGVSNAGSHTRHPIDASAAIQAIENPGYNSKLEAWRSRVVPQELQLQLASQMRQAQMAQAKQQTDAAEKQALARMYDARAGYYQQLPSKMMVPVTPEMEKASGGMFKAGTQIRASTANVIYRQASTTAKNTVLAPGAQLVDPTGKRIAENTNQRGAAPRPVVTKPQDMVFDPVTGKLIAQNTNQRQFAPRGAGRAAANPQQAFTDIENEHQRALAAAEERFKVDHDEQKLNTAKRTAEDNYRKAIIKHHGTVTPQQQPAATPQQARPPLSAFDK